jgi:hypothetical protein
VFKLQQHFGDKEGALASVRAGHSWGALYFGTNFSSALNERYEEGVHTSDMTLAEGEIDVWLDMTGVFFTSFSLSLSRT